MNIPITVIIVNLNGEKHLKPCLDSLRRQTHCPDQTVVFDNASTDNSLRLLARDYPDVRLVPNNTNIGFCRANNICLQEFMDSDSRYAFLLNADTVLASSCLEKLIRTAEFQGNFGIFSPKILYHPDTERIWYAGGYIDLKHGIARHRGGERLEKGFLHVPGQTDFVSGCSMFLRKKLLVQIGFLDERFFAYFEDADISVRANRSGMGCYYEPSAVLFHKGGTIRSPASTYYFHRNRYLFARKHASLSQKLYFYPFIIKNQIKLIHRHRSNGDRYMSSVISRSLRDGLLNRFGKRDPF